MRSRSIYTKELGQAFAAYAVLKDPKKYHVVSQSGHWKVVRNGSLRALRVFDSIDHATEFASKLASSQKGEVVIHTKQGLVGSRIFFN